MLKPVNHVHVLLYFLNFSTFWHYFICVDREDIGLCASFSLMWIRAGTTEILAINQDKNISIL